MLAAVVHPHRGREEFRGCFVAAEDVRDYFAWVGGVLRILLAVFAVRGGGGF